MRLLLWLFFIICFQALRCLAIENPPTMNYAELKLSEVCPPREKHQDLAEFTKGTPSASKHHILNGPPSELSTVQKGKGIYGGNDILHRTPKNHNAASSLLTPWGSLMSFTMLLFQVVSPLVLVFLFIFI